MPTLPAYNIYALGHKYIRGKMFAFTTACATCNFDVDKERTVIGTQFDELMAMLEGHGAYEDREHVRLLSERSSPIVTVMQEQHRNLDVLKQGLLKSLGQAKCPDTGYDFYLQWTAYVAEYLQHMLFEERVVLAELLRLYSVGDLRARLSDQVHRAMTVEQMAAMLQRLLSVGTAHDAREFLQEIRTVVPDKLTAALKLVNTADK